MASCNVHCICCVHPLTHQTTNNGLFKRRPLKYLNYDVFLKVWRSKKACHLISNVRTARWKHLVVFLSSELYERLISKLFFVLNMDMLYRTVGHPSPSHCLNLCQVIANWTWGTNCNGILIKIRNILSRKCIWRYQKYLSQCVNAVYHGSFIVNIRPPLEMLMTGNLIWWILPFSVLRNMVI